MTAPEEMTNETQTVYEAAFHIDPHLSETETKKVFEDVQQMLKDAGEVVVTQQPKRIDLAYTISLMREQGRRDYDQASFAWVAYEGMPEKQAEIEEALKENTSIIRYLIVKTTKEAAEYAAQREEERKQMSSSEEGESEEGGDNSEEEK